MANDEATPQHWEQIEMWAGMGSVRDRCLYSLMRRVKALEEQQRVRDLLTPDD